MTTPPKSGSFQNRLPRKPSGAGKPVARPRPLNLRAQVIQVLMKVTEGESLSTLLPATLEKTSERDRGLVNELVMGTLRHWFALEAVLTPRLARPLTDPLVEAVLHLGLYQILQTRIPPHAAISETVDAIKQLGLDKASGLVNALLRRALREQAEIQDAFDAHHALPDWMARRLQTDWGDAWQNIAQDLRQSAPLFLRVNVRQRSRNGYLDALALKQINASSTDSSSPAAIELLQSTPIQSLPGYLEGWFSVQDLNAQRSCGLFEDEYFNGLNGKIVVDACAAPGGKTAHLLERYDVASLIALDSDSYRLKRVHENLNRLKLTSPSVTISAQDANLWQAPAPVDAILLDAPCTATGVLRRHPDIRLLRTPADVTTTVKLQARLLDHLWTQLAPGGRLVYVTCSLLKAENEDQIADFVSRTADAIARPITADWGLERPIGRQCLPEPHGGDGFYFAVLDKRAK